MNQFLAIIAYFQHYQWSIKYVGKIFKKSGAFYRSLIQMQINGKMIVYLSTLFILSWVFKCEVIFRPKLWASKSLPFHWTLGFSLKDSYWGAFSRNESLYWKPFQVESKRSILSRHTSKQLSTFNQYVHNIPEKLWNAQWSTSE